MSSLFTGTAQVSHKTKLPAGVTKASAVAMLHDHAFYLECDPHLVKYSALDADKVASLKKTSKLPKGIGGGGGSETRYYEVHDLVHNLPGGLWDSNVVSSYEMTDTPEGVFVRIRSPMSVVMDTYWTIREMPAGEVAENGDKTPGGLAIVEEITIIAPRLVVGIVKGLCEGGWKKIHDKMLTRFQAPGQAAAASIPPAAPVQAES
ncbi:hypothetical protein PpBr36_07637 [Pyricularia pennisetigena]|uniref:hypothetical protein n=1 Tax=Pyricularia pennisetigena TaxID=1578925 RepID=UPI001153055B|nr:hypothetical protein PpBr36_07637 [Pyricularia pennisetigena]TLS25631.1 hypothetical protein PpBr36_07637 [Pyricularia pennisetigena]